MKKIYFISLLTFVIVLKGFSQTVTWSPLISGTTNSLLAVSVVNTSICYVSGASGTILKTTNGGTTWVAQTSGTTAPLYGLYFVDANNGYAVGDDCTALKTTNGGATWTAMTVPTATNLDYRFVYFTDANTGYITGGVSATSSKILKTTNGGTTWTSLNTSISTNGIYSIFFTSPTDGYATDFNGKIIKTVNGGTTWTSLVSGTTTNLQTVYFTSVNNGIVTGDNGIIRTTSNAGSSWSGVVSGTTTDYLTGIGFYSTTNGFVVGGNVAGNTGIILSTTDGGNTWSTFAPGSKRLMKVDLFSPNLGYAVGLDGTILKYSSNVGIAENETAAISFNSYPNPFSTATTIDCKGYVFKNAAAVEVVDITGKVIRIVKPSVKESTITLEKDGLAAGAYFYKIYDGSVMIGTGKMIAQ